MDRRTVGTKNPGCCREVAVIDRWPLVEVPGADPDRLIPFY